MKNLELKNNKKEADNKEIGEAYNITATRIAPIIKEYGEHPYWASIPCYMDAFAVYFESLMSSEQIKERITKNKKYHNRFGSLVEPFVLQEFFNVLGISEEMQKSVIAHNKMYKTKDKIACTPDFIIENFPEEVLDTINNINQFKLLLTDNFRFNFESGFKAADNNFLMEVKSRSLATIKRDYTKTEDVLIPDPVTILQFQTGLLVTGYSWGVIATLVTTDEGIKFHYYFMQAKKDVHELILNSVKKYFEQIKKGIIPKPSLHCKDESHQLIINNSSEDIFEIDLTKKILKPYDLTLKALLSSYLENPCGKTLTSLERFLSIHFMKNYQEIKIKTETQNYKFYLRRKPDDIAVRYYSPGEVLRKGKFSLEVKKEN